MEKRINWHVEKRKVKDLKPYTKNPRVITEIGLDNLKKSFDEIGFAQPININLDNTILSGHARVQQLLKENIEEIDCYVPDRKLTPKQEEAVIIRMNKNVAGEWDFKMLMDDFDFNDLQDWGFKEEDFENIELPEIEKIFDEENEDKIPEVKSDPITKKGDLWILGEHRLLCGDSTFIDDVEELMNGQKADMVFTDPPYNLETKGGSKGRIGSAFKKQGKNIEFISNFDPREFLQVLPTVFNFNLNAYIFCNKDLLPDYLVWSKENNFSFNVLVWKKPNALPIGGSHRPDIEYLLLFRKSAIFNSGINTVNYSKVIEHGRESGLHPTMKPIAIIENQLKIGSNLNSLVVDFFLGSGSTLIACEKTKRRCYGLELLPKYCDVIIKRWQDLTGKKAILEKTKQTFDELSQNKN